MITCQTCQSQLPETSRFCGTCGSPVSAGVQDATVAMAPEPSHTPVRGPSASSGLTASTASRGFSSIAPRGSRFGPGALLAGRYQIIGLLGKGGMGEVYRANDLTLDQDVALKFLPETMSGNPAMLARFHGEVRIARQVSHQNVCRVYDIGEVEGHLFLSMEYVDGEDLGLLLRRIGRLPSDKAVEFSRKICAGLAAAHEKGVLHRDLKPANIMIDSHGRVVIMDFGLAAVSDQVQGMEIRAGTPAYMSPEQLAGQEVSVRSDIYALGLVLYEMFTGKRPFEGNTLAELVERQRHIEDLSMTTVVRDIEPAVESVILRCLAPDPRRRPGSALAVAAALPGGDPLAAALAAGDTPSPEMVAASGRTSGMRPLWAIACALGVILALVVVALLAPANRVLTRTPMELPPEALNFKAQDVVKSLGYTQRPVDTANGFIYDIDYIRYIRQMGQDPARWNVLSKAQPAAVVFWYRQSPRYLEPLSDRGGISYADPPERLSGMISIQMDTKGRLTAFTAIPPQLDEVGAKPATPMDWSPLFAAAGLDGSKLKPVNPLWTPLSVVDTQAAWEGTWPEAPDQRLRVEAAAWRGRVVYFDLIGPWTRPSRTQRLSLTRGERNIQFVVLFFAAGLLCAAALLARYNIRRGRGDKRSASRLGAAGFVISLASWAISAHYVPTIGQVGSLFSALAYALLMGGSLWLGYMALEPYVRRHWPGAMVSWTRLLAGGIRDPLVGRDIVMGVVFGLLWAVLLAINGTFQEGKVGPQEQILVGSIASPRHTIASAIRVIPGSLLQFFAMFFLLFLARLVLRKEWLAAVGFVAIFTVINAVSSPVPLTDGIAALLLSAAMYFAITKFGLITFVVAVYVNTLLLLLPVTADFSEWYSGASAFTMVVVLALAAYGLHTALAGRSLIQDDLL